MRDLRQVEIELRSFQHLKAFAVRLKHPVLDAVVDHFNEMSCAAPSDVSKTILRRQSFENRLELVDDRLVAAEHHAVTDLQAPDTTAGANVDEMNSLSFQFLGAPDGILIIRVAAVDDDVIF